MSAGRHAWMGSALCAQADPDEWTDIRGSGQASKRICHRCPVRANCEAFEEALTEYDGTPPHGVWAGHGRRRRQATRRQQAA